MVPKSEMDALYRELAHMYAVLATVYSSQIVIGADAEEPEWPVLFINTPTGQLSKHISKRDLDLFVHVPKYYPYDPRAWKWDGHTTDEKYERIRKLIVEMLNEKEF